MINKVSRLVSTRTLRLASFFRRKLVAALDSGRGGGFRICVGGDP